MNEQGNGYNVENKQRIMVLLWLVKEVLVIEVK
jgi:hypothetical protein